MGKNIVINDPKEAELLKDLEARTDIKAERAKRLLALPDLSRTEGSPIKAIADQALQIKEFGDFYNIIIPEIISVDIMFDLFNFAPNHPARSETDSYFVDNKNVLRPHDTVMWYYFLNDPEVKEKIKNREPVGVFCYGKVYRKDEVDRNHMNVFHQMGGLYLVPDEKQVLVLDDLKNALSVIVKSIFGENIKYRFNEDTFPYTDPSLETEIEINGKWIEVLGGGMPRKNVLSNFGVEGYNGWAYGFGLERLAIVKMEIPDIRIFWSTDPRITSQLKNLNNKYKEVSKFPPIDRDISFIIDKSINLNNYYEIVRDFAENLIEEVKLVDEFENDEKFGAGKKSYTFRIVYRSPERTLTNEEVNKIQEEIRSETVKELSAVLR